MREITASGYEVFVVGGAVRDLLLGREPKDYDLTTDARPDELVALAEKAGWKAVDQLGRNFGVVAVVVEGEPVEIATYRGECYGVDSHRPEQVWRAESLEEDLSRRDFTFNAMALDLSGKLYDPFDGKWDLDSGVIRTVGSPKNRFQEDALRMFRACRFASELGFAIDPALLEAIPGQLGRVAGLSLERVREEIRRILLSKWPSRGLDALVSSGLAGAECSARSPAGVRYTPILPELLHLVNMPQNPLFHAYDVWRHTLKTVEGVPGDPTLRWAALLHDVAKGMPGIRGVGEDGRLTDYGHDKAGAEIAEKILQRFDLGKALRKRVVWLISRHMRLTAVLGRNDDPALWRWLRNEARAGLFRSSGQLAESFWQLGLLCSADIAATGTAVDLGPHEAFAAGLADVAGRMPVSTRDLHYNTKTIQEILGRVDYMGPFLKNALMRVQDGNLDNCESTMEQAAQRWRKRHMLGHGT